MALDCAKELQPVWMREGDDNVEALSVEIFVKNMNISCCVAYGCQESDSLERKEAFWTYLDEEVLESETSGSGFILHFDGNLWAGKDIFLVIHASKTEMENYFKSFLKDIPILQW